MGLWTLDDIPWERFDHNEIAPEIVAIVKAASLVEANGATYAGHLCRIFADDPEFQADARRWGEEEAQHGWALGRWAELADREFDFAAALARFRKGYRIDFAGGASRRGSRAGEMTARCIVETGTASYYSALRDAAPEPVLKQICRYIAADEVRHYRLFYRNLAKCLEGEPIGLLRRLALAIGRVAEARDDELAYAYYAANETGPYDRRRCRRAYARNTLALYRERHVAAAVKMICKTVGIGPNGGVARIASWLAWTALRQRVARLAKAAA